MPGKIVRTLIQLLIGIVVIWGLVRAIQNSASQLQESRQQLELQVLAIEQSRMESMDATAAEQLDRQAAVLRRQIRDFWKADIRYLVAAGLAYAMSMLPAAYYWQVCLRTVGQTVPWRVGMWAYFSGNLGKYSPGKAMVIVMRLAALAPLGVHRVATTITIFIETLTMMSVGGAVAAACLVLLNLDPRLSLLAIALLFGTFLPTTPPLLRFLLQKLQPGVEPATLKQWSDKLNLRLTVQGWLILGFTWLGFGLSLGCVLSGLPSTELVYDQPGRLALAVMGACALAVVLGFVSLVPGGAGVREVALSMVLTPVVGPTAALSCALWLRIVWLITELLMAVASYFIQKLTSAKGK